MTTTGEQVNLRSRTVNFLVDAGEGWEQSVRLGFDITGGTVTAPFTPAVGTTPTALNVTVVDAATGSIRVGQTTAVAGTYRLRFTNAAGASRRYLRGDVRPS